VFYYLVQDLKVSKGSLACLPVRPADFLQCLIFSLVSLHFRVKPSKHLSRRWFGTLLTRVVQI
jgi:hypothetical protein